MRLILLICLCLQMNKSFAQQTLYSHVEFQELGLSFDIPQGWKGQLTDAAVILGHYRLAGLMILTENQSQTAKDLKKLAMEGLADDGVQLTPVEEFDLIGENRVEGFYQGTFSGFQVKAYAIGLINGMNIVILTEAKQLTGSVKFYQAKELDSSKFWRNRIVG